MEAKAVKGAGLGGDEVLMEVVATRPVEENGAGGSMVEELTRVKELNRAQVSVPIGSRVPVGTEPARC